MTPINRYSIRSLLRSLMQRIGFKIVPSNLLHEYSKEEKQIIRSASTYSMTGEQRLCALIDAVKYIVAAGIPGDVVECGVWRGGSIMAAAEALLLYGDEARNFYLYDTFEGMPCPADIDVNWKGVRAINIFRRRNTGKYSSNWCRTTLNEVKRTVYSTRYPKDQFRFVKGLVEETIPQTAPSQIALLRLDTDWYESTKHEMTHLFPRLVSGGVLIIDDYGYWQGARKAVDEYLLENHISLLLNRIDHSARIAVKQ